MALPAGRVPSSASATQVRRYQPPSGCGARSRAAISDSPGRTRSVCRGTDAQAGGDGEGVRGGATEERSAGGGPLDVEVAVVLPGEADATEGLDRFAPDEALAVVGSSLGHGDGGGAVRRVLVDGGDGEIAEGTGPLDGEEHVAHFVLDRLEGADGDAELLALLDVGQQQLEEGVAGADRLEREPDRRLLEGAGDSHCGGPAARRTQGAVVGDEDALERGVGEGPARIERMDGGQAGLRGGHDECTHAIIGAGDDDDRRGALGGQDAPLDACEQPAAFGRFRGPRDVLHRPGPRVIGQRHRPGDGTGGHLREEPLLLLGRADFAHHRGELRDGGQERTGGDGPAQLLDDDGRLEDGQADAAVLLGYAQGGPVEGHHGPPELLGRLARLDDGAHDSDGAFPLEERADRGTQFLLLSCELQLHRTPFPALPVAHSVLVRRLPQGAARSGRVHLTPLPVSAPVLSSRRPVFWEGRGWVCPGGSPVRGASPDRRRGGLRERRRPPERVSPLAYTLRCASSST